MVDEPHLREIPTEQIDISPLNVRRDPGDLSELIESVRAEGILQPILVRPVNGRFEAVVGSRRLLAARDCGLKSVPAVVRQLTDAQAVAASLTENLQRGDLGLEERAQAYLQLQRLDPDNCGTLYGLAKTIGRGHTKIAQDLDAYEALLRLRPHGLQIVTQLQPAAEERRRGDALPERHATLLEQAFSSVRAVTALPEQDLETKYVELAREIAPLDQDNAKRVLDHFKMYPERPVRDIVGMALAKVEREVVLDAGTARKLDELASATGRRWDDVIVSLVEQTAEPLVDKATVAPAVPEAFKEQPRYEALDLPEDPLSEQIITKLLWNLEQSTESWDFYTVGYSQKSADQFVRVLKARDIRAVVDVRHDPVSMYKPEFSRENLRALLESQGIRYVHRGDLGVPRNIRLELAKSGAWEDLFRWYDENVIPTLTDGVLGDIRSLPQPVAFMCVELSPTNCHRHRIALALRTLGMKGADL